MGLVWLPSAVALGVSAVGGELLRRFALRRHLVDRPNERSLHKTPLPRMGGIALVAGVVCGVLLIRPHGDLRLMLLLAAFVAVLGAIDDVKPLTAAIRFPVHLALAIAFVVVCGPAVAPLPVVLAVVLTVIGIAGLLNIYNFMDGMDGLAGSQAIAAGVVQALAFHAAGFDDGARVAACIAAASAGFLAHNFPPARMFMGDAGATALGFTFAALAALGSHHGVPVTVSLLPLAPFLLDGTLTIVRRVLRKEKPWRAHRTHLYQRAVQCGLTHKAVLAVYGLWLGVCALATAVEERFPFIGWAIAIATLAAMFIWVARLEGGSKLSDSA